jgi:hypothetical protein
MSNDNIKLTWVERVKNREIFWMNQSGSMEYGVYGDRVNVDGMVVKPERKRVCLYYNHRPVTITDDNDWQLKDIATLWKARVELPSGEIFDAGAEEDWTQTGSGAPDQYPYFKVD